MMMCVMLGAFIFSGLYVFSSKRKHMLSALLSLEYIVLVIYLMFFISLSMSNLFYSLIYITFAACEGALGLSILVLMSRTHGGDYFKSLGALFILYW